MEHPQLIQIQTYNLTGSRWDRTRCAGVLLLDVFNVEHPKGIQGSLLRRRSGENPSQILAKFSKKDICLETISVAESGKHAIGYNDLLTSELSD